MLMPNAKILLKYGDKTADARNRRNSKMEMLIGKAAPVHDGTGQKNRRRPRKKSGKDLGSRRTSGSGRPSPCVVVHLSGRKRSSRPDDAA